MVFIFPVKHMNEALLQKAVNYLRKKTRLYDVCRSSHFQMFFKTGVFKNLAISQENTCFGVFF